MIIRATLPINTVPDPNQPDPKSGLGDANIFDIFLLTRQGAMLQFGAGPLLVARTATSSVLGTGKWQAGGAAVVVFLPDPNFLLASLITYSHSFAGDDDRPTQSVFSPQYLLNVQIGGGFYVRSTPTWTFDFVSGNYVIPFGAGIGKVSKIAGVVVNSYIEPQYSILHHGVGQPAIQIASGLNFQFPSGQ